ncbi:MAG: queuosine precursor transporter [Dehalococcoidia bacterium]
MNRTNIDSPWIILISSIFVTSLLTSNIIAVKLVDFGTLPLLGAMVVDAAIIVFPISYIIGDVLTEVYGFHMARRIIWIGFICNLIMVIFIYIGGLLTPSSIWPGQESYTEILGFSRRLIIASFLAYLFGEFANSYILAKLKIRMKGKFLFVRTISSTLVGQGLDSLIFVFVAFGGLLTLNDMIRMVLINWGFKVFYETVATPLTYGVINFLKNKEGIDIYDNGLTFNPFFKKN